MVVIKRTFLYPPLQQSWKRGILVSPCPSVHLSVWENYSAAKKFNYTRRFIDDLHTLNNDGHLEENNNMGRIYPQELKLNQENQNDDKASFLDLEEQIKDACIEVKTYDKRVWNY